MSNEQGHQSNIPAAVGVAIAGYFLWKSAETFVNKLTDFVDDASEKKGEDNNGNNR